jgi:hypothetical protein
MEVLPLARKLWRRWRALAAGAVVAIAVAVALGSTPTATTAVAWTRVALDTPKSQLVDSAPPGADTLPWRASLIKHLMTTDAAQRQVAERLRVRPDEVAIIDPILAVPQIPASMPKRAADAAAVTPAPYVLTLDMKNTSLPVISVEAAAPDRDGAKRLAEAAVAVLETWSSTSGSSYSSRILTGGGAALKHQSFVIQRVASVRTKAVATAELPVKQIGVAGFLFAAWCVAVFLLPAILRRRIPRPAAA